MAFVEESKVYPRLLSEQYETANQTNFKSTFNSCISSDANSLYRAEKGRYHLYASHDCPFSAGASLYITLKGLEDVISVTYVHPLKTDEHGWEFVSKADPTYPECRPDPDGNRYLYEVYLKAEPKYTGEVTVPVLWDKKTKTIVSNDSGHIMRFLDLQFHEFTTSREVYFYPDLTAEIEATNLIVQKNVNTLVFDVGFAKSPEMYQENFKKLFDTLDSLDNRLSKTRYLNGSIITESDWRLFQTLIRFDIVYYGLFKCDLKRIQDYPNLSHYLRDLYQVPKVSDTIKFQHIKAGYYGYYTNVGPKGILPLGGVPDLMSYHDRNKFTCCDEVALAKNPNLRPILGIAGEISKEKRLAGEFIRGSSGHRQWITADGSSGFKAEPGRYHIYIANNCPWCHRVALARGVKGLERVISMDVLYFRRDDENRWQFKSDVEGCTADTVNGKFNIREVYALVGSSEKSVPVLWDKKTKTIVNNESADIIRMFNNEFQAFAERSEIDLYPDDLRGDVEYFNSWIFPEINNGAYRAGFASGQESYEAAYNIFFKALDKLEQVFSTRRFLCGDQITEADIRLFPTLFRFDPIYYIRFNLNLKKLQDYKHLPRWLEDIRKVPGVMDSSNLEHCIRGYFGRSGNQIIPEGALHYAAVILN